MRASKFFRIDPNILLEYIYDDGNLISEPYSVIYNTNTEVYCFVSSLSKTKNYISQKSIIENGVTLSKLFSNQLVKLDTVQGQWGRLDLNSYSFIQKRDFGTSIPIRYDKIRVWMPYNYVFGDYKGFHLRVYTLDFDDQKYVDLSNYFFDITDVNQIEELDYSNPPLYQSEMYWGKYVEIQFPSVTKVSDQRRLNITRENTINYNLTEGKGLSKTAPVFLDFFFISSQQRVNNIVFYNLTSKRSISVPQTPEFEKFGVVIEPSTQGDFFIIYPLYNGSLGEFNVFVEESLILGNRYYLDYTIDVYEKNIKSKTQRIIVTEDFIEEIEFRPIFKFTTSTAIIEVTCKLIDAIDGSEVVRTASYGLLQDEVSNYSKFLSKINLTKAEKVEVYKIKGIASPNLDIYNSNTIKSSLKINKVSYVVYSKSYNIVLSNSNSRFRELLWLGNRQSQVVLFPYDNILQFKIIQPDAQQTFIDSDLTQYDSVQLTIRDDKKSLTFDVFRDIENNFSLGEAYFKIPEEKYFEIKKVYESGSNLFYINGIIGGNRMILYTGLFITWNSQVNIVSLENTYSDVLQKPEVKTKNTNNNSEKSIIQDVKTKIGLAQNIQTSTNTSEIKNIDKSIFGQINLSNPSKMLEDILADLFLIWKPYWLGDFSTMIRAYNYQFESNTTNSLNKYVVPVDPRSLAIQFKNKGLLSDVSSNKKTGQLSSSTQAEFDLILGYFKINNFNPQDVSIQDYVASNIFDLKSYLNDPNQKPKPQSLVPVSGNLPPKNAIGLMQKYLSMKLQLNVNPNFTKINLIDLKNNTG